MFKSRQPESSDQLRDVSALIWKGLGSLVVLRLSRTFTFTSYCGVSESVPASKTDQLAMAPTALSAVDRLLYSED